MSAYIAGAIYISSSTLNLTYCFFTRISAKQAGVFKIDSIGNIYGGYLTFRNSLAIYHGVFQITEGCNFNI